MGKLREREDTVWTEKEDTVSTHLHEKRVNGRRDDSRNGHLSDLGKIDRLPFLEIKRETRSDWRVLH